MLTELWLSRIEEVAREDLVTFINACFACTGQREFYSDAFGQGVSIDFLHDYILGNYRLLYARTLAAGINHFNTGEMILKLLATGKNLSPEHRVEEGALIAAALKRLPPQRAWKVLEQLKERRINNRRSRAIARDYIRHCQEIDFHAIKYRSKVRAIASHAHLNLAGELGNFLFRNWQQRSYQTPLFEQFRQAHYSGEAIYHLPFTIAEGLAAKHQIPRDIFLSRIQSQMTQGEKLRWQQTAQRTDKVEIPLDYSRLPLTRLALYALSLPPDEREEKLDLALIKAAERTFAIAPFHPGKVAAILDCSYSSSGSSEKRRRPLGVALAAHYLLKVAAREYRAFWTIGLENSLRVRARGQTDLATPLLDALEWEPDLVVIISDGCENDPPQGAAEVLRVYRRKLDPQRKTAIVHCNPVFDGEDFSLRSLSPTIPTVGLRDAEDLPAMLNFARFAEGAASLGDLEDYLAARVEQMLLGSQFISTVQR